MLTSFSRTFIWSEIFVATNISQWKRGEPVTSENMASAPSMTNQPLVRWRFETGIRSYSFWVRLLFDTWLWGMRKTMAAMVFFLAPGFWCLDPPISCRIPIDTELVTPLFGSDRWRTASQKWGEHAFEQEITDIHRWTARIHLKRQFSTIYYILTIIYIIKKIFHSLMSSTSSLQVISYSNITRLFFSGVLESSPEDSPTAFTLSKKWRASWTIHICYIRQTSRISS